MTHDSGIIIHFALSALSCLERAERAVRASAENRGEIVATILTIDDRPSIRALLQRCFGTGVIVCWRLATVRKRCGSFAPKDPIW